MLSQGRRMFCGKWQFYQQARKGLKSSYKTEVATTETISRDLQSFGPIPTNPVDHESLRFVEIVSTTSWKAPFYMRIDYS